MKPVVFFAIVIFVLIIILFIASRVKDTVNNIIPKYEEFRNKSIGTFDEPARKALVEAQKATKTKPGIKRAKAKYAVGNIIEQNLLEGTQGPREQQDAIITTYTEALNDVNRANTHNINNLPEARRVIHMVDHITNYFEDMGVQRALMEQLEYANRTRANLADNIAVGVVRGTLNPTPVIQNNINNILVPANNKKEFAENFTTALTTHTSDPQNVHDSSVRKDNLHTLSIIKQTASDQTTKQGIINELAELAQQRMPDKARNIHRILGEFSKDQFVSSYNETDGSILKYVYDRSLLPENNNNRENIQNAILESLAAGVQNGNPVCIAGRVSNVIGSLVTLDHNPEVGAALTEEQYKNEVFREANNILQASIAEAKNNPDAAIQAIATSYTDPSVVVDPNAQKSFTDSVVAKVNNLVDSYKGRISDNKLELIRRDCHTAVS